MKKIQIQDKKLQLNKSNIASLSKNEMGHVCGGEGVQTYDPATYKQCDERIQILSIGHQCSQDHSCHRVSCNGMCCSNSDHTCFNF